MRTFVRQKFKMEFEELKIEIPVEEEEEDDNDELQLPTKKYENKSGSFVIGFDVNSKESVEKRDRRKKRFGVIDEEKDENDEQDITEEDETCDILPKEIPTIPQGEARLDALVVYGIQDLSTKDVFDYFKDYGPGSIEWIDDFSCNVVWDDEHSATTALDCLGKDIDTNESETSDTNKIVWKAGPPCKKAGCRLLMRLSKKKDKKQPGAAKRSMYYLVHGYPGQSTRGTKGLVTKSRKRKLMQEQERARHKSSGEPDVAFIDKIEETEDEKMDVDEPALKVVVKNDRTTEDAGSDDSQRLGMRMHADEPEQDQGKIKDRLQERLQPDIDSNIKKSSGDLRERLKSRRKHGFDFIDRPSLSIEIREEKT